MHRVRGNVELVTLEAQYEVLEEENERHLEAKRKKGERDDGRGRRVRRCATSGWDLWSVSVHGWLE